MCFQDHADIVGPVADGERYGVLLGSFNQLHDLQEHKPNVSHSHCGSRRNVQLPHLGLLQRRHPTAEHGTTVATDL